MSAYDEARSRPLIACLVCAKKDLDWRDGGGQFCSSCIESGWAAAHVAGRAEMARAFWASVCAQLAVKADALAAVAQARAFTRRVCVAYGGALETTHWPKVLCDGAAARRQWDGMLAVLDGLDRVYAEARDAADVGRQLRAWAVGS